MNDGYLSLENTIKPKLIAIWEVIPAPKGAKSIILLSTQQVGIFRLQSRVSPTIFQGCVHFQFFLWALNKRVSAIRGVWLQDFREETRIFGKKPDPAPKPPLQKNKVFLVGKWKWRKFIAQNAIKTENMTIQSVFPAKSGRKYFFRLKHQICWHFSALGEGLVATFRSEGGSGNLQICH